MWGERGVATDHLDGLDERRAFAGFLAALHFCARRYGLLNGRPEKLTRGFLRLDGHLFWQSSGVVPTSILLSMLGLRHHWLAEVFPLQKTVGKAPIWTCQEAWRAFRPCPA